MQFKKWFCLAMCTVITAVIGSPPRVESACTVGPPIVMTYATFRNVKKYLNPTGVYGCRLTSSMNVGFCFPSNTAAISPSIASLSATAMLAATSVSCAWRCYCNPSMTMSFTSFDIDGGDGLPVELMDFEIADSVTVESDSLSD